MESYIKTVREELSTQSSKHKKNAKIKFTMEKYDSEEVFCKSNGLVKVLESKKTDNPKKTSEQQFSQSMIYQNGDSEQNCEKNNIKNKSLNASLNTSFSPSKCEYDGDYLHKQRNPDFTSKKMKFKEKKERNCSKVEERTDTMKLKKKVIKKFASEPLLNISGDSIHKKIKPKSETDNYLEIQENVDNSEHLLKVKELFIKHEDIDFDFEEFAENHSFREEQLDQNIDYSFDNEMCSNLSFAKASIGNRQLINQVETADGISKSDCNLKARDVHNNIFNENTDMSYFETLNDYCVSQPSYSEYDLPGAKLLIIDKDDPVIVYGYMKVQILYGCLTVFGKILKPNSEISLYSPRGAALLTLKNVSDSNDSEFTLLHNVIPKLTEKFYVGDLTVKKNSLVVLITKLIDPKIVFLEEFISQQIFPKSVSDLPPVLFNPSGNWNAIKINLEWDQVLMSVNQTSKFMLVGGKGVGKSTLLRYSINKLLDLYDKVRIIDLDPGQSEFTVPGCVSIVTVERAIFEPNYLHLKKPERSILSSINVGNAPGEYLLAVKSLISYYNNLERLPTIINYMGFTGGIGLNLVAAAITYVSPTHVVQIIGNSAKKNFSCQLSVDNVLANASLFCKYSTGPRLNYELTSISSMCDENDGWKLEPRQMREMCILAYFGQMMNSEDTFSLTSSSIPMYEKRLTSLKLVDIHGKPCDPSAANANLVALCSLENDNYICHGWGIVRGIDCSRDNLVLITPESISVLSQVDHLVVGCLSLPPTIYMHSRGLAGLIPYVMEGELDALSQFTKRVYKPPNKR